MSSLCKNKDGLASSCETRKVLMKLHGKRERKNVSVVRRPWLGGQRDWDFCEQVVPHNKSYCKRERSPRAATCESISTTGPKQSRMQIRGESREERQSRLFLSLYTSRPSTSSLLSFIFHLAFFLSDLPECRLREHKDSPFRPVIVSPRETPFAFFPFKARTCRD